MCRHRHAAKGGKVVRLTPREPKGQLVERDQDLIQQQKKNRMPIETKVQFNAAQATSNDDKRLKEAEVSLDRMHRQHKKAAFG